MAKKKEKSSVFPIIIVFILLIACVIAGLGIYNHLTNNDGQSRISNDIAEKDTQSRYLTIINDTDQIINEVHITVGEGTEIEHGYQLNPDEKSFSIKIPDAYNEYDTFKVTSKEAHTAIVKGTNEEGERTVRKTITEETYIKLGSTVENPKKSSVFIIAIADEKLRKYAEGKGITLEELPKWRKTIDQFQKYVDRGFKNTFFESGYSLIIILIAVVIVLGYLAFHLTGIAAIVCGAIDVLFIIGFVKGLLGL